MKRDKISDALNFIEDDIIEATDAVRNNKNRRKNHWKRLTALAACLCLMVGVVVIVPNILPIGGKCGGNLGTLVDGVYYYSTDFGIYSYTPEGRDFIMPVYKAKGWKVDDYGIYYTSGRSLYVRKHDSGKTQNLYQAENSNVTHTEIKMLKDGIVTLRLRDKDYDDNEMLVQVDGRSGEVIWQEALTREELLAYGRTNYPVGNAVYSQLIIDGGKTLYRDGKPFLPEGTHLETDPRYYGDNLLIRYQYDESFAGEVESQDETRQSRVMDEYILVTPSGETIDVPDGDYLTGTNDFLLFKSRYDPPHDVYSYDLQSGESILLYADMDIYTAVTDGVWLYTNVPWSGRTDCWKLVFDDTGKLVVLELVVSDI